MAHTIYCPRCNARGTTPFDNVVFQGRGQNRGTPIAKCMKCGCGLAFGFFSGIFLGNPKLIPDDVWQAMEMRWNNR